MKTERNVNELSGHRRSAVFQHYLETHYVFRINAVQKTMKTQKNVNDLFGPPEKRSFSELSTLLQTVCVFRLDTVQKSMRVEKYVDKLSDSLGEYSFEH